MAVATGFAVIARGFGFQLLVSDARAPERQPANPSVAGHYLWVSPSHRLTLSAIVDTREDAYWIVAHGSSIKIHWTISVGLIAVFELIALAEFLG